MHPVLRRAVAVLPATTIALALVGVTPVATPTLGADQSVRQIKVLRTVNLAQVASTPSAAPPIKHLEIDHKRPGSALATGERAVTPKVILGGSSAPPSTVVSGGDNGSFNGIDISDMKAGGTGTYDASNLGLEPPDQGLCVGNGYVMETVNDGMRVYTSAGTKATAKSVPLSQFYGLNPANAQTQPAFISDPRCYYDPSTQRWFVTILEVDQVVQPSFLSDNNYIAVSKTNNPLGDWYVYSFNVSDNGLNGSPLHTGCVTPGAAAPVPGCLGDQPLIGADANGIYISDNEYSMTEVFPVGLPVGPPLQQIPSFLLRSGVAQVYALSKQQLVTGSSTTLVQFDTNGVPFPGPTQDGPWQSLQPASPPPHDTTVPPPGGAEYFMSDIGLPVSPTVSNQIAVWAWTNTASLNTASPNLTLQHVTVNTLSPADTFFVPDPSAPSSTPFYAYQKAGPHPRAAGSGDAEDVLNANDDRMNAPMLSNGSLWAGVNTSLPALNPSGSGLEALPRVGIMYFQVTPSFSGPNLQASMTRDGYIQVSNGNVLFPSIGARPDGATIATFTLAGIDNFPSVAWARLDGLAAGSGPDVHVSRPGLAPDDGFTALGLLGQQGLPDVPPCTTCVGRWGDYSYSAIDEAGCIWGAAEGITTGVYDSQPIVIEGQTIQTAAGDWGTGIHHVCPPVVTTATEPITVAVAPLPNTSAGGTSPLPAWLAIALVVAIASGLALRRGLAG